MQRRTCLWIATARQCCTDTLTVPMFTFSFYFHTHINTARLCCRPRCKESTRSMSSTHRCGNITQKPLEATVNHGCWGRWARRHAVLAAVWPLRLLVKSRFSGGVHSQPVSPCDFFEFTDFERQKAMKEQRTGLEITAVQTVAIFKPASIQFRTGAARCGRSCSKGSVHSVPPFIPDGCWSRGSSAAFPLQAQAALRSRDRFHYKQKNLTTAISK